MKTSAHSLILLSALSLSLLSLSCGRKEKVVEITETRVVSKVDENFRLDATSDERFSGLRSKFEYQEQEDWVKILPTQFRLLNFKFGQSGEVYVSISGGGLLQNTNRWLKQFEKEELDDQGLALLPRVPLMGGRAIMVKAEGDFGGGMGKPPQKNWALRGVLAPMQDQILTVKMMGPKEEVEKQQAALLDFCRTLNLRAE